MNPMTPDRTEAPRNRWLSRAHGAAGFTIAEILVVAAVIGLLFTMTIPFFLSYYRTAAVRAASQQVVALFDQARDLAIRQNSTLGVCVRLRSNTQMRFIVDGCNGTVWVGIGTDADGNFNLPRGYTLTPATDVVFDYLGAATPAVTYTMADATSGASLAVRIAVSGQVRSP